MGSNSALRGVDKAAILLMHLGEELAARVAGHMTPEEMKAIAGAMADKDTVPFSLARTVADEFIEAVREGEMSVEGLEFARKMVTGALDPEEARFVLDQISRQKSAGSMESLKWMDAALVADVVKNEHPQIVAFILAHLDPEKAARVLEHLPGEKARAEVMLRVAALRRIPGPAVADIEEIIRDRIEGAGPGQGRPVEGSGVAAEILGRMGPDVENSIMGLIEEKSPELASEIQERMLAFTGLVDLEDGAVAGIAREVPMEVLALALVGAGEALKDKFLRNISEGEASSLRAAVEARGPASLSEVSGARRVVTAAARRRGREGRAEGSAPGKGVRKIV